MSSIEIKKWLANPNRKFEDGLKLYNAHKTDQKKDQFYSAKPTFPKGSIQINMLINDLTRILRILDQNPLVNKSIIKISNETNKTISLKPLAIKTVAMAEKLKIADQVVPNVNYSDLPDEMKIKFDRIKALSKELGGLKLSLSTIADNEERRKVADDLCNKWDERHNLWVELDTWFAKNQNLKENISIEYLKKEIKKRRDYINRNIKEMKEDKTLSPKKKQKREENIKRWETEIEALERKLLIYAPAKGMTKMADKV